MLAHSKLPTVEKKNLNCPEIQSDYIVTNAPVIIPIIYNESRYPTHDTYLQ